MLQRLEDPRAPRFVFLAGMLLVLPTLAIGFFTDDWFMLAALRRTWSQAPAWWDLYDFVPSTNAGIRADIANGALPWWTTPSLRLHLVRPVSSALLALDARVFGDHAIGWHAHSLLWWAAVLLVVSALFRRLLPGATGTLALLLFALAPAHALPYGWPSARHMLVAAVPALLGLLAHVRWREERWAPGRWLAPVGLMVGLAASEAAVGVVAFVIAYDLFSDRAHTRGWSRRFVDALPTLVIASVYLVLYRVAGGGAAGNDAYLTPFADPSRFAGAVALRFPMLLSQALVGAPVDLAFGTSPWPFVVLGLAAGALAWLLFRAVKINVSPAERAALSWLVPGSILAVLTTCGGLPGGRVLLVADVGFSVVLAVLIRRAWELRASSALCKVAGGLLVGVHLVLAPVAVVGGALVTARMAREETRIADALPAEIRPARRVFILAASDPLASIYVVLTILGQGHLDMDCLVRLSSTKADFRVTRVSDASVALEPIDAPLLRSTFETLYRSRALPFAIGDEVSVCGAQVRVAAVEDGSPTRLDVNVGTSLDDETVATVAWDGERLRRVRLGLGETRVLPWRRGPMQNQ